MVNLSTNRPQDLLLQIKGLNLGLNDGPDLVTDIHLDLYRGDALGLAGESGSGKSLTALAVMGLLDRRQWRVRAEQLLWWPPAQGGPCRSPSIF